ncbi:MAG: ABC transporter ATP-binding protein [Lachnospiraceae bacterium]|jgi:cobalt/nickel transport system ATP-binding protein|nr:ABC transporter ATP-binding protein [Lachnospiraceae bacterium]
MIVFENVSFSYDNKTPVIQDINMRIQRGETVGLIGANGAGKSTILKLILGLLEGEGRITVDGLQMEKQHLAQIRQKVGFVLQDSDDQMFMPTVYEDMIFGPRNYGITKEEAEKRVDRILAQLGLQDLKYRYNHKISGGEKRMAAIATILAMEPEVILMDEPSTALDPFNRRTVIHTIQSLPQTKLIASHDLDMILDTCDRVILLSRGKIAADGVCGRILRDKELLEANRMELPFCLQG